MLCVCFRFGSRVLMKRVVCEDDANADADYNRVDMYIVCTSVGERTEMTAKKVLFIATIPFFSYILLVEIKT